MILSLVMLILGSSAQGQDRDRQYRRLTLVDGRTLTAEILATEATGLRVRTPQGDSLISFEVLLDMVPAEQADYADQKDWVVFVVAPEAYERDLIELTDAIPGVAAYTIVDGASAGGLTGQLTVEAGTCGSGDLDCIIRALADTPTKWIVTADVQDAQLVLQSKVNSSSSPPERIEVDNLEREGLWPAVHTAIGLDLPTSPPPKGSRPATSGGGGGASWSEQRVLASSFVPLPGYTSLAQGDGTGFALALGVVVPSTAIWVGAVGETGQSPAEFVALSAVGFYASTVLVNQVVGMRSLRRAGTVVVAPSARGVGGTVSVAGTLGRRSD